MDEQGKIASITLFSGIDRELSYIAPDSVEVGSMVRVPLRGGSAAGVVTKLTDAKDFDSSGFKLKKIY